jgi:hypothetical protein
MSGPNSWGHCGDDDIETLGRGLEGGERDVALGECHRFVAEPRQHRAGHCRYRHLVVDQ